MFDKQKIIAMTAVLEEFVRVHPNIFILPEVLGGNLLSLLKRLKANVVGIMTNAPVNPRQNIIQTPSGNYPLINFSIAIPSFDYRTGIIISSAKQNPNPIFPMTFKLENFSIEVPAFSLTDEEALAIYDRLTTLEISKRYQEDGVITNMKDTTFRFARGMSTFIDSRYQDIKLSIWDRRKFKIPIYDVDDAAIVMQGPLWYEDNYTINTAQFYRQWYPNAPIIISTWKNEATEAFREECKKIGVVLLENALPTEAGYGHINYQLESSFAGVNYVKNHTSTEFVLKCRTDQRFNRTDFLIYFKNLTQTFPPKGDKLKKRIVFTSSDMWIPFFMNDFMVFGNIESMNKFYGISKITPQQQAVLGRYYKFLYKVNKSITRKNTLFSFHDIEFGRKLRNYNKMMSKVAYNEMFIVESFYRNAIGAIEPEKILQQYWRFMRDYAIICDEAALLVDWPKYTDNRRYAIPTFYDSRYEEGRIDFTRWLDIYLNYKDEDE